jgi:hypothetical protein
LKAWTSNWRFIETLDIWARLLAAIPLTAREMATMLKENDFMG